MAWVRHAEGAERLSHIIASHSLNPEAMRAHLELYRTIALTERPAAVTEAALDPLREAGLDERAIVDANQVVAYFNYVNRIAEGLGVGLEDTWKRAGGD